MVKPVITDDQYQKTRQIVEKFGEPNGEGEELQSHLTTFASSTDNWIMESWLNDMYMRVRLPLPVNSNPGMVFPPQTFRDDTDQLRFASRLISGILDYKVIIDSRALPVDRASHREKGQPLCMEQYYRLFTSYRVPGIRQDTLVTNTARSCLMPDPEHIIVICNNQFFVLDVVINFTPLSVDNLFTQLKRIQAASEDGDDQYEPVGVLTSLDRDSWATSRMRLMEVSTNRDCLDLIERCMFILCLDKSVDDDVILYPRQTDRDAVLAAQMLHGSGTKKNSCNRWFDKTMQFVISDNGTCGLNYEHSPAEGIAVVQLIEHLLKYMEEVRKKKFPRLNSMCELPNPRRLRWKTTDVLLNDIYTAKINIDSLVEDLDLYVLRFDKFGRDFPKTQGMSPDSFIQLAIQLAFYKINRHLVPTYESASIRRFYLGRVDNIRSASPAALDWVRAMAGDEYFTEDEKMTLLRKAIEWQANNLIETILGYGVDNHLLGLRDAATSLDRPTPEIFTDESYQFANKFVLSTSQVPTTMDAFMCYGPVVSNGYGVCYNPHPKNMVVCVISYKSVPSTDSEKLSLFLESAFHEMYDLCLKANNRGQEKTLTKLNNNDNKTEAFVTENCNSNCLTVKTQISDSTFYSNPRTLIVGEQNRKI